MANDPDATPLWSTTTAPAEGVVCAQGEAGVDDGLLDVVVVNDDKLDDELEEATVVDDTGAEEVDVADPDWPGHPCGG